MTRTPGPASRWSTSCCRKASLRCRKCLSNMSCIARASDSERLSASRPAAFREVARSLSAAAAETSSSLPSSWIKGHWFRTTCRTGICAWSKAKRRRLDSATARCVGIDTTTKFVICASSNTALTEDMEPMSRSRYDFVTSNCCCKSSPTMRPRKCPIGEKPDTFWLTERTVPIRPCKNRGNDNNRSVWPVGAVSITTRSNSPS
mmetsp:Transcript_107534/g.302691  ORF Transcript_107534/g.302691 Transcript_107534/m.302691 type:complete len:204 (-) Transcript_107534:931-1542(-)